MWRGFVVIMFWRVSHVLTASVLSLDMLWGLLGGRGRWGTVVVVDVVVVVVVMGMIDEDLPGVTCEQVT